MKINREYVSKENTYQGQNKPKYIVIHETDNWSRGAGAQRHASAQAAGHLSTSVHYYSGSDGVYQAAEHTDGTYSVGREYGGDHSVTDATNRNTINIEICVNADGDYNRARANAIELVKHLIQTTGIPAGRVIRHYDAKGKYCPRNMMDNPALWSDFKAQLGRPETSTSEAKPGSDGKETWYRVGSGWANGICQGQIGAYHNLDFAIADCGPGQYVYDEEGNIRHTEASVGQPTGNIGYTQVQFVRDVQAAIGAGVDGIAGSETLGKTVTVSANYNRKHAVVRSIQRRLNALSYDCGEEDGIAGKLFTDAVRRYQTEVLGYQNTDGEVTARKKMWKSILGMI